MRKKAPCTARKKPCRRCFAILFFKKAIKTQGTQARDVLRKHRGSTMFRATASVRSSASTCQAGNSVSF